MIKIEKIEGIELSLPNWKIFVGVTIVILSYINKDYVLIVEFIKHIIK